jgi:hypothetical protein
VNSVSGSGEDGAVVSVGTDQTGVDSVAPASTAGGPRGADGRLGRDDVLPGIVAVSCALGLWTTITWLAARSAGYPPLDTESWGRWDTGWYRTIAQDGYSLARCIDVPNRTSEDYCGAAGWFPGFPYLMRVVADVTGSSVDTAGRAIAVVALTVMFAVLWFGFLAKRPLTQSAPAMVLAAAFPAGVYYGAIFPVSIVTASMIGALALMQRQRWLAAGICAMAATIAYPSGLMFGAAALVPLLDPRIGSLRQRVGAAARVAVPVAVAYLAVLANLERAVGRWDGWFRVQESYGYEPTWPTTTVLDQLRFIPDPETSAWIGVETLFILVVVVTCVWIGVRSWHVLGSGERAVLFVGFALWLPPLVLGGDLSLYRAESLLVVSVVLLGRLRPPAIWAFALAAIPIAYNMAQLFFAGVLI